MADGAWLMADAADARPFEALTCSAPPERSRRMRDVALRYVAADRAVRILDLGCGTGALTDELARALPLARITGLDISPANIAAAARRPVDHARVRFELADYLAFEAEPYDLIVTDGVLHLIPGDTATLVRKLARDLAPSGVLVCAMPYACAYNAGFAVVRRGLRALRSAALDRAILAIGRALHGARMNDEALRERVHYMYMPPHRVEDRELTERIAPSAGLRVVARHAMPSTSAAQLKHRVTVYRKEAQTRL
jgi:SAM-dependent methyltransferase